MEDVEFAPAKWLRGALFALAFIFILAELILLVRHRHVPTGGYSGAVALAFLSAMTFRAAYDDGARDRMNSTGIAIAAMACVVLLGGAALLEALWF